MGKGQVYNDPKFTYEDAYSGRTITRLTDYLGHSNHFYFTDPCWFNNNRSFFFTSDRGNQSNLFRYDLDGGKITQLTDLNGKGRPSGNWSKANQRLYFGWQNQLYELDPVTYEMCPFYEGRDGFNPVSRANPTADGKYIITHLQETVQQDKPAVSFAYSRFQELFHARPLTQIVRIELSTGKSDIIHEDKRYMTHINTSPANPTVMTFCHEGPWQWVEQRIWGLNIETGKSWKIRPQDDGQFAIGHEYWFADGEHIGYHGRPRDGKGDHVFGRLKWDNSNHVEVRFPFHSTHFHSLDEHMIVGDGTPAAVFSSQGKAQPFIQLFRWNGEAYIGPKILAYHRSTFNDQHAHCHPRFTPDGKYILYATDLTSYSNIYLAEIGDFDDLPDLTEDTQPRHT